MIEWQGHIEEIIENTIIKGRILNAKTKKEYDFEFPLSKMEGNLDKIEKGKLFFIKNNKIELYNKKPYPLEYYLK